MALRILRQKHTPDQIAGGVALGLFVGFALPPGLQIIIVIPLAMLLKVNVFASVSLVFVSNPFTMPIIYPFAAVIGSFITGIRLRDVVPTSEGGFWSFATNIRAHSRVMVLILVGCVTMGAVASIAGFYGSRALVIAYRRRRRAQRQAVWRRKRRFLRRLAKRRRAKRETAKSAPKP